MSGYVEMFGLVNFFTPKSREKVVAEEHEYIAFNSQHLIFLLTTPEEKEMWQKLSYKVWKAASKNTDMTD